MRRFTGKIVGVAAAVIATSLLVGPAEATLITMTVPEAQTFTGVSCTGAGCVLIAVPTSDGTTATVIWPIPGPSTATFSSAPFAIPFVATDQFAFSIYNGDFVPWTWEAVVHTSVGDFLIPPLSYAGGTTNVLLTSVFGGVGTVTGVDVIVSGTVPVGMDLSANFQIAPAPIPEPGTLLLLGSGLLGLAARRRRSA